MTAESIPTRTGATPGLTRGSPTPGETMHLLAPPAYLPRPPRTFDQLDIPENMLLDLTLRHVSLRGVATIRLLADLLKLSLDLTEAIFRRLSDQHCLDVQRSSGDDYVFSLSPGGRRLAAERANTSRYAGPAPVSLASWKTAVRAQVPTIRATRDRLRAAFSDIVVSDQLLDALGPALISQRSIFLYGPSGTGKTTIAERLARAFEDAVVVPYGIEADGQIITMADPAVHEIVAFDDLDVDPRWMVCRRPFVAVGGELMPAMLDLDRDDSTGAISAPLQMKANNGILLIDDLGRQRIPPRDLLNRWIVPLDRRIDFLSLGGTGKFEIPFDLLVVFSTNLQPHELADEAFLRRLPNKILVAGIDAEAFDAILRISAAAAGMECEPGTGASLRELCLRHSSVLRACFPRDICAAIRAIALYEERQPTLARADLERAVAGYFV
jgi:hypothetical protein